MIICLGYNLSQQFILLNNVYTRIINCGIFGNHDYISHKTD